MPSLSHAWTHPIVVVTVKVFSPGTFGTFVIIRHRLCANERPPDIVSPPFLGGPQDGVSLFVNRHTVMVLVW
jgi:hypothetical protein